MLTTSELSEPSPEGCQDYYNITYLLILHYFAKQIFGLINSVRVVSVYRKIDIRVLLIC